MTTLFQSLRSQNAFLHYYGKAANATIIETEKPRKMMA